MVGKQERDAADGGEGMFSTSEELVWRECVDDKHHDTPVHPSRVLIMTSQ